MIATTTIKRSKAMLRWLHKTPRTYFHGYYAALRFVGDLQEYQLANPGRTFELTQKYAGSQLAFYFNRSDAHGVLIERALSKTVRLSAYIDIGDSERGIVEVTVRAHGSKPTPLFTFASIFTITGVCLNSWGNYDSNTAQNPED